MRSCLRLISAFGLLCLWPPLGLAGSGSVDPPSWVLADLVRADSRERPVICEVCEMTVPAMALERLDAAMATAVGQSISDRNLALVSRADSLLEMGYFGDPDGAQARREAGRYFNFHAVTAMDFISYLATQESVAWESDEGQIRQLFLGFANPGIYPVWGLRRVLLGGGAFCMEFDILKGFDAFRVLGVRPVRLRSVKVKDTHGRRPAWDLEMPAPKSGQAHYLFCERYSGRIRRAIVREQGEPLVLLVLEGIEGFYVKKWGTHKCEGLVFWRTYLPDDRWPPRKPQLGAAAYFPGLRLRLPSILPDVNLDDLRSFSAVQPLIAADRCRSGVLPDWLQVSAEGLFEGWENEGPIPAAVREWFPDL